MAIRHARFVDGVASSLSTVPLTRVPFLDLRPAYAEVQSEIDYAIAGVLESGRYIGGPEVELFESEWAQYCGARYCVGVGNGLDALILSLRACGVGPGDGVIVPSNTFIATWLAVSAVGAEVQPVDPDVETFNLTLESIGRAVNERTKAILPVHLYGHPVEIDSIAAFAKAHGLLLIEDAAQANGASWKGRRIGGHGDAVCWSFYPGKNLGGIGDAGAITTNNRELADRVRELGNYGSKQKYVNRARGINSRLDPVQAAVLRVKLQYLEEWNQRRRNIAARYDGVLRGTRLCPPSVLADALPVWHLYVVRCGQRDRLQAFLEEQGIGTLIHYPIPPHRQDAYRDLGVSKTILPAADELSDRVLSLPMGPHLSLEMVDRVCEALERWSELDG